MTHFSIPTWISLVFLVFPVATDSDNKDDNLDAPTLTIMFNEFVEKFQKVYPTPTDQLNALSAFSDNFLKIQRFFSLRDPNSHRISRLNRDFQDKNVLFGINEYSDLTDDQFSEKVANLKVITNPRNQNDKTRNNQRYYGEIPTFLDWRTRSKTVGEVRDQGTSGCGWAYAISAVVQSANSFRIMDLVQPNEKGICDCAGEKSVREGLEWLKENGVPLEDGKNETCGEWSDKIHIYSFTEISPNSARSLQESLFFGGPLLVQFKVVSSFRHYKSGVFNSSDCQNSETFLGWHAGELVGYGTDYGVPYWMIRNSWGEGFGEKGYVMMVRGEDLCAIESTEAYSVEV